jgi:hypothetical protein
MIPVAQNDNIAGMWTSVGATIIPSLPPSISPLLTRSR